MSLSKPVQVRQPARACYCPRCRLGHGGQSGATASFRQVGTSQRCLSKAQTSFWLPRVRPRGYLKIDQGRSLLRAPQRCLSFKLPAYLPRVNGVAKQAGSCVRATSVHRSARTHILAVIRLFTCQRAFTNRSNVRRRFSPPVVVVPPVHSTGSAVSRIRGGGIIASAARLSTGCRENCLPHAYTTLTRGANDRASRWKASVSKLLQKQRAADNATPRFRHPSRSRPKNGSDKPSGL